MNCLACGLPMVPRFGEEVTHPTCLMLEDPDDPEVYTSLLKQELLEIIRWQADRNPRNTQVNVGPSEIGNPCDRHLGYRLAGVPEQSTQFDPWASVVGTAIHTWLERAVQDWQDVNVSDGLDYPYLTETTLDLDGFITGHADLYDTRREAVIDWKTVGPDKLRELELHGPPDGYRIQTQVYGYMFAKAGRAVKKVALVFLPRASLLSRMYVWVADYNPAVAETALGRVSGIATKLLDLDILMPGNEHRWEQVPAVGGNHCGFCPWYQTGRDPDRGADATGCPGR